MDLIPYSLSDFTLESYLTRINVSSKIIYWIIIISVIILLAVLPFIYVDVSVLARGYFQPDIEKQNISIKPANGGVTISQLYSKSNSYSEKNVIVKGQVVKVNNGIMQRNWVHIQDGTSSGNYYDLTVTTNEKVNVGDVVTFQGKIELNQDFGYGYAYPVLLADAVKK